MAWREGCAARGTAVVVVDDVVTTGGSTIDAIRKCREEGLRVVAVVALVIGVVLAGDVIRPLGYLAMGLILSGVALLQYGSRRASVSKR